MCQRKDFLGIDQPEKAPGQLQVLVDVRGRCRREMKREKPEVLTALLWMI